MTPNKPVSATITDKLETILRMRKQALKGIILSKQQSINTRTIYSFNMSANELYFINSKNSDTVMPFIIILC